MGVRCKEESEKQFRLMWQSCLSERTGASELLAWMEAKGFFEAPASKGHHLAVPGGLCEHTVNVAMNAADLCNLPAFLGCDAREAQTAALLHDLCKIDDYKLGDDGKYQYAGKWNIGHGEESVVLAMRFMHLKQNEILAIRWHMGAYSGRGDWAALGRAYESCPLALLLHFADMMATYCDEREDEG